MLDDLLYMPKKFKTMSTRRTFIKAVGIAVALSFIPEGNKKENQVEIKIERLTGMNGAYLRAVVVPHDGLVSVIGDYGHGGLHNVGEINKTFTPDPAKNEVTSRGDMPILLSSIAHTLFKNKTFLVDRYTNDDESRKYGGIDLLYYDLKTNSKELNEFPVIISGAKVLVVDGELGVTGRLLNPGRYQANDVLYRHNEELYLWKHTTHHIRENLSSHPEEHSVLFKYSKENSWSKILSKRMLDSASTISPRVIVSNQMCIIGGNISSEKTYRL